MPHLTKAIEDAVSAGYEAGTLGAFGWERMVLDPKFWQFCGKARGWPQGDAYKIYNSIDDDPNWLWYWHAFINHLAKGADAESFFASLPNNPKSV